jgi:hypothetical protein
MKTISFCNVPREPHCSPDTWHVEPFDEELDLWTLGTTYGFVWVLMSGDPDAPRCRSLTRSEGVAELKEQLATDPGHVVLAGNVAANDIDLDFINFPLSFSKKKPIDAKPLAEVVERVCERLRDLQYYDGNARIEQFEHDGENGGCEIESIWSVLEIDLSAPQKKRSKSASRSKPSKQKQQPSSNWKNKPIVEMTELERKRWHDSMGSMLEEPMLEQARSGPGTLLVAAAVLILPNGQTRLLHDGDEWGDGEGSKLAEHTVAIAELALLPSERVRLDLVEVQLSSDGTCTWTVSPGEGMRHEDVDDILAPGLTKALDEARRGETEGAEYWLAVLTTAVGEKRIIFAAQDGMGEARPEIAEFVLRARRMNWLKPGESVDRARLDLRPLGAALAWDAIVTTDPVAPVGS